MPVSTRSALMHVSGSRPGAKPGGRGSGLLRTLDGTLGVAALAAVGAVSRRRAPLPSPRRVGLMKTTGIGDMVLMTAVARDVVSALPAAEVVLFASAENAEIARMVDRVRVVELPASIPWQAIRRIRRERLDVFVDFGQWSRVEALYSALSGAERTVGFRTPGQRRHYAYDVTVRHREDVAELDNYRRLAAGLGVVSHSRPSFRTSGDAPALPADPYVVFHLWPGGFRSTLREWPERSWRELAERVASTGQTVVLTGGAADVARADAFVRSCHGLPVVSVAGRYTLTELVDVLAAASCVVSVNTGVMHLAAAVGARTVALNGPTSSRRWGPIGRDVACVDSELPGCGYLNLGFEYAGRRTDCMSGISVERVVSAAMERICV